MNKEIDLNKLIDKAKEAREQAYAPYSNFLVGAAIVGESGKFYTGCNIENSSFGLSICAERVALFKAVSEGEKKIKMLALVTNTKTLIWPCGGCRQVLSEFGGETQVIVASTDGELLMETSVSDLLPGAFGPTNLPSKA